MRLRLSRPQSTTNIAIEPPTSRVPELLKRAPGASYEPAGVNDVLAAQIPVSPPLIAWAAWCSQERPGAVLQNPARTVLLELCNG